MHQDFSQILLVVDSNQLFDIRCNCLRQDKKNAVRFEHRRYKMCALQVATCW